MKKYIFMIVLPLFLLSCNLSDKEDIDKAQIVNILRDIEYIFNSGDSVQQKYDKIMAYYHEDYLHNSERIVSVGNFWHLRINDFTNIKIDDISISLDDDRALARFKLTFFDRDNKPNGPYPEPTLGILSFFWHDFTSWRIYGNQISNNRF